MYTDEIEIIQINFFGTFSRVNDTKQMKSPRISAATRVFRLPFGLTSLHVIHIRGNMSATEGTEEESPREKTGDLANEHRLNLAAFIKNNGLGHGCHFGGKMFGAEKGLSLKLERASARVSRTRFQLHKSTHPVLRSRTINSHVSSLRKRRHSSCCDHDESLDR